MSYIIYNQIYEGGAEEDSLDSDSDMLLDDDSAESEELEVQGVPENMRTYKNTRPWLKDLIKFN